jgi:biotin carboxyl carrier protein
MIKKIRVTVDRKPFDVTVEIPDEAQPAVAPAPVAAPVAASAPAPAAAPASAPVQAAAGDVPSPLSGHIVSILVTPGQAVKKGDTLLSIEAMKMNTAVLSPKDGKVSVVHVKVGDVVSEGQPVAQVE